MWLLLLHKIEIMKQLLVIIAFFFGMHSWAQTPNTHSITISGQTDRAALWQIHQDLKADGLNFNYNPEFNNERKLVALSYTITDAAGVELDKVSQMNNLQSGGSIQIHLKKKNGKWVKE